MSIIFSDYLTIPSEGLVLSHSLEVRNCLYHYISTLPHNFPRQRFLSTGAVALAKALLYLDDSCMQNPLNLLPSKIRKMSKSWHKCIYIRILVTNHSLSYCTLTQLCCKSLSH